MYNFILFTLFFLYICNKNNSFFTCGPIFLLFFSLYYILPSLDINKLSSWEFFVESSLDNTLYIIFLSLFFFIITYLITFQNTFISNKYDYIVKNKNFLLLVFILFTLLLVIAFHALGAFNNLFYYGEVAYSGGFAGSCLQIITPLSLTITLSVFVFNNHNLNTYIFYIILITLFSLLYMIGVRSMVFGVLFPVIFYFSSKIKPYKQFILLVCLFMLFISIRLIRGVGRLFDYGINPLDKFDNINVFEFLTALQSQAFAFCTSSCDYIKNHDLLYGYSLLEYLIKIIPGPLRILLGFNNDSQIFSMSEWASNNLYQSWNVGGLSFTPLAELILNFGFFTPVIFVLLGYFAGKFDKLYRYSSNYYCLHIIIFNLFLLTFFRVDISISLKKLTILFLSLIFIRFLFLKKVIRHEYIN